MKFVAVDGKVFDTSKECKAHEARIKQIFEERDLDWELLKQKEEKYEEARKDFSDALDSFCDKYNIGIEEDNNYVDSGYVDNIARLFTWFITH